MRELEDRIQGVSINPDQFSSDSEQPFSGNGDAASSSTLTWAQAEGGPSSQR